MFFSWVSNRYFIIRKRDDKLQRILELPPIKIDCISYVKMTIKLWWVMLVQLIVSWYEGSNINIATSLSCVSGNVKQFSATF